MHDDLIERIYGAVTEPDTWLEVLDGFRTAFDAHSGTLAFTDSSKAISELAVVRGVFEDDAVRGAYMAHFRMIDPAVPLFLDLDPCRATTTAEAWAPAELVRDEFYNDFFLKLGLRDAIGANLFRDGRTVSLICLQREIAAGPFGAQETAEFASVSRHLRRALQLRRQLSEHLRLSAAFDDALTQRSIGAILLDARGRVWHWNALAQEIVEGRDGFLANASGIVEVLDRTAAQHFAALCGPLLRGEVRSPGGQFQAPRGEGRRPFSVLVASVPPGFATAMDARLAPAALLLISDPERIAERDFAASMAHYRLTQAELGLLADLAAGHSLAEHCDRRRISINTGKFHLKALFAKTGARGQVDLVRMALTGG